MRRTNKILISIVVFAVLSVLLFGAYKVLRWHAYVWLPAYLGQQNNGASASGIRHVLFLFVNHYEPGLEERGIKRNREWLSRYRRLADQHLDSYGRKPVHSWFYAYDHRNREVMADLAQTVYDGYGEIEFHWHHANDSNASFRAKLGEAIQWYNSYGSMIDSHGHVSFGFIHGNWSLDNSMGKSFCGVNRELDILKLAGCYADFTFPAFGSVAQPAQINSLYYAIDNDGNKSYNTGEESRVGLANRRGLLMFQGPLGFRLNRKIFEFGAIERDSPANRGRIDFWISQNIIVQGRPEWIFIKIHTHGIQDSKVFFSKETHDMFSYLEDKYGKGSYRLHYITAREAYNIVRAAEDGRTGDPDHYRNYHIKEPLNKQRPYKIAGN